MIITVTVKIIPVVIIIIIIISSIPMIPSTNPHHQNDDPLSQ